MNRGFGGSRLAAPIWKAYMTKAHEGKAVMAFPERPKNTARKAVLQGSEGGSVTVNLLGKINKCAAISPRFPVQVLDFETRERRYLPAKGFGILIVTTPKGIMIHSKAADLHVGGLLLAYCY